MEDDEEATVRTITAYRELMVSKIQNQNGRVVDAKGDNLLAEFSSVVDAVRCAVEIQGELARRNEELPEHRKMEFRIGVNLGDVIEEEETIYGDGVNIAARLEALAEGGGICISGTTYDQVENKLGLEFEYLGEQSVKNIKKRVRVYRLKLASRAPDLGMDRELPLPDKPSIAVLPFVNMSGDPEQEYFSDGMSEDIITALSQLPEMFVIARNSSFVYKGRSVNVQQVGRELGVRYVLEGSVRKVGDRVRITAQLIDATTGHHLWAERYDRELQDIFAVQDDITGKILLELEVKLIAGEQARLYQPHHENLEAILKMIKARGHFNQGNKEGNVLARKLCEEAISMEPEWELPYSILGWTHVMDAWYGWTHSPLLSVQKAFQSAQKAIALDEFKPISHGLMAHLYGIMKQHEKAIEAGKKAIELDPNSADAHLLCAMAVHFAGEPAKAISLVEKAIRLNPFPPASYLLLSGHVNRNLGHHEESVSAFKNALKKEPTLQSARLGLAASYSLLGLEKEASVEALEVLKLTPDFSLTQYAKMLPFKKEADLELYVGALRKAGLPE
jgi:adenylate cyclase